MQRLESPQLNWGGGGTHQQLLQHLEDVLQLVRRRRLQLGLQQNTAERTLSVPPALKGTLLRLDVHLEQLQHAQGEGLVAEGAAAHHLDEDRQGTRQLSHGKHHLVGR